MACLIVIVNFRTPELVAACLRSLKPDLIGFEQRRVVVVDNASGDDSPGRIAEVIEQEGLKDYVRLITLETNRGFAAGNNAAIVTAQAEGRLPPFVLLLNPDTLVFPGLVASLIEPMRNEPGIGITGARLENLDGTARRSAFRFHSLMTELCKVGGGLGGLIARWAPALEPLSDGCEVDWVSGACMCVRRELIEEVGAFDPGYFMYFEEQDLARRARRAGWRCWYVPDARVIHLVGQSSGINMSRRPYELPPAYWFRSRQRYFVKQYGRVYAWGVNAMVIALMCLREAPRRLLGRPPQYGAAYVRRLLSESRFRQPPAAQ